MRPTLPCSACGTVLGVPKGGVPKDGLPCNWCGYVNQPASEPAAVSPKPAPEPVADPAAVATTLASPEPVAPHRWADDLDDNGRPYTLPADEKPKRKCEGCGKEIDQLAVVCVHCGYDAQAKKKVERTFTPIDRTWESGWPFERRLAVFLGFQALNGLTVLLSLVVGESLGVTAFAIVFSVALQAFIIGTYDTLRIRRNKKGQTEITITWRIGFVPTAARKVNWREREGVAFGHYDPTGLSDWWIFLVLLPWFIFPAILWWWFVIRSDRFFAALARDRGYPETYLYRGMNEAQAKEICQVTSDVTGLPLVTPL